MRIVVALAIALAAASPALGQPAGGEDDPAEAEVDDEGAAAEARGKARTRKGGKEKLFDFTGLELDGTLRMPQLLYFLERAQQELERASLERRSFIPEMVRTLDEEPL